eukprot:CAMPEP_0180621190 /NCGR_PEP_ID=MMETSP1037_2-20121125/35006_1 /TAXON_ID=632150 /ORGANISM="Azadinium spinosum, Strain 3D9" /LENGTH=119 /DNA_ID=CAMNT_0022641329 /DNA_START=229 /DNA_END=589 /DNA_ORIENTATION=+
MVTSGGSEGENPIQDLAWRIRTDGCLDDRAQRNYAVLGQKRHEGSVIANTGDGFPKLLPSELLHKVPDRVTPPLADSEQGAKTSYDARALTDRCFDDGPRRLDAEGGAAEELHFLDLPS